MRNMFFKLTRRFSQTRIEDIDYKSLINLSSNNNAIIIDVRTKDEYYNRHIPGAINIPLQDINSQIEKIVKNKNEIIIVYCEYGGRSRKACNKIQKLGYTNIYNLKNGIAGV